MVKHTYKIKKLNKKLKTKQLLSYKKYYLFNLLCEVLLKGMGGKHFFFEI